VAKGRKKKGFEFDTEGISDSYFRSCPFCGQRKQADMGSGQTFWVLCESCLCEGPLACTPSEARKRWNYSGKEKK